MNYIRNSGAKQHNLKIERYKNHLWGKYVVKYTVKSFTKVEIFYGLTEFCLDVSQDETGQKIHGDALKYLLLNSDIKSISMLFWTIRIV